ncbi:unnamed protein product [Effrenium voratum]|nr:unnamed protein product [Effrenium voratum]
MRRDVQYAALLLDRRTSEAPCTLLTELRATADRASQGQGLLPLTLFSFNEVVDALKMFQQARHIGKIVLTMAPSCSAAMEKEFSLDMRYLMERASTPASSRQ